jgi:hypothetical protein
MSVSKQVSKQGVVCPTLQNSAKQLHSSAQHPHPLSALHVQSDKAEVKPAQGSQAETQGAEGMQANVV